MLFPRSSIPDYLNKLGLQQNDTVMIQGDAGVAAQLHLAAVSDCAAVTSHASGSQAQTVLRFIDCVIILIDTG